jgi:hypothetical protein
MRSVARVPRWPHIAVPLTVSLFLFAPRLMSAQPTRPAPAAATTAPAGLPDVPLTRVLAIGTLTRPMSPAERSTVMPQEVRETVQLYLGGKISDWYVRKDQPGVVFLLSVPSVQVAHELLEALPLGVAKLMTFELIPLGPLSPLALLAGAPADGKR